jgi:class 3 adenylate cyclase/streptogramin lyase
VTQGSAGTNGFLFCDLRGYTAFVEAHGDQAAASLLATYRGLVRAAIAAHAGAEIKTEGDSVYVVFPAASAAVEAGLAIVAAAAEQSTKDAPVRVGVGIHAGETVATTEGLVGGAVNIAARVCAKAQAGEVLVTDTVRALTRTYLPYRYTGLGTQQLKGIAGGIPLYRIEAVPSSGRARLRRQLGARRGRVLVLAGLTIVLLAVAGGVYALNRPTDCLTLPASTKDVVAKIDPARNCVVAVYRVGYQPGPIVAGAGSVWVANLDDQTVTRLDPETGDTHTTSAHGQTTALAASDDSIWSLDGRAGQITQFSLRDGRAIHDFVLPSTPPDVVGLVIGSYSNSYSNDSYNAQYDDLAAGSGRVWVSSRKEGDILRLDPRQDESSSHVTRVSIVPAPPPVNPHDGFNALIWPGTGIGKLAFADGTLWIADVADARLWRTDVGRTAGSVGITSGVGAVDLISSHGTVWITHADGTLTRSDIGTGRSELLQIGAGLGDGAADGDGLWVADTRGRALIRIGGDGRVITRIPLVGSPSGVAVMGGSVWITIQ